MVETVTGKGIIAVEVGVIWDLVGLYSERCEHDYSGITGLEALAHLLIDTPIGDDIANEWRKATGGNR